jgi:hypothetical protein
MWWWAHASYEVELSWCVEPCENFFGKDWWNSWFAIALALSLVFFLLSMAFGWWSPTRKRKDPPQTVVVKQLESGAPSTLTIEEIPSSTPSMAVLEWTENNPRTFKRKQATEEYARLMATTTSVHTQ